MSIQKVNHNKWLPFVDQALAAVGTGDNATSEWWDTGGWTDKRVSWEVNSGGVIDFDMEMHISPKGYFELRALADAGTISTDDYEVIAIVTAHTAAILASRDADDIDELQRPVASTRFVISNDQAQAITGTNVYFEGWS